MNSCIKAFQFPAIHISMSLCYVQDWLIHFMPRSLSIPPEKHQKTRDFLMFSGGVEGGLFRALHKKWSFQLRIFSANVTNPQESMDLITFTEEIFNGKLHFLCSGYFEFVYHIEPYGFVGYVVIPACRGFAFQTLFGSLEYAILRCHDHDAIKTYFIHSSQL